MTTERRKMEDRRTQGERIGIAEHMLKEHKEEIEEQDKKLESLKVILLEIQKEQAKTQTIIGGAFFVLTGLGYFVWEIMKQFIGKVFH